MVVTLVTMPGSPAMAEHECYYDPNLGLVCEDHGSGGGGGSSTSYWTSWQIVGQCGGGGVVGGGLIDISTGLVLALRDHIVDGEVVETQTQCIDLEHAEDELWEEIATAIRALPDPRWESNPDASVSAGLTGGYWNTGSTWANRISSSYNGCYRLRHWELPNKSGASESTYGVGTTNNLGSLNNRVQSVSYHSS
jgi:hypothetical protein